MFWRILKHLLETGTSTNLHIGGETKEEGTPPKNLNDNLYKIKKENPMSGSGIITLEEARDILRLPSKAKYKFGKVSLERREQIHPNLQTLADVSLYFFDTCIICGHRSKKDQLKAFRSGNSSVKVSKHNSKPSTAIDMGLWNSSLNNIDYDSLQAYYYSGSIIMLSKLLFGEDYIRCGGDWDDDNLVNDHKLKDPYHFEIK